MHRRCRHFSVLIQADVEGSGSGEAAREAVGPSTGGCAEWVACPVCGESIRGSDYCVNIHLELTKLGNDCVDALQAHDDTTGSLEALNAAELKLKDIRNSPSVDAACRMIDDLAEKKELDSALVLMLSKAWSAAKGTGITKSEAKDIMPKDIRILKHLLMIEVQKNG